MRHGGRDGAVAMGGPGCGTGWNRRWGRLPARWEQGQAAYMGGRGGIGGEAACTMGAGAGCLHGVSI